MSLDKRLLVRAFTMTELMVSVAILLIISVAVAGDMNRTKFQEELNASARVVAGVLRDSQTMALAVTGVRTCAGATQTLVCETTTVGCTNTCGALVAPTDVGVVLSVNATSIGRFAEVVPALSDRRKAAGTVEDLGRVTFLQGTKSASTANMVRVQSLTANTGALTTATITFERQNGNLRINACDTPAPVAPCGAATEPISLDIVLQHPRTLRTRTVRISTIGKISLE